MCNCLCCRYITAVYLLHLCRVYVLDNQSDMNGIYNAAARVAEELEIMCM